jgi:hypothetical protein
VRLLIEVAAIVSWVGLVILGQGCPRLDDESL